jgi:hypothetical protein
VSYHADSTAQDRFELVQGHQSSYIEELVAAGLEESRDVGGAIAGAKSEWLGRRHLAGVDSTLPAGS